MRAMAVKRATFWTGYPRPFHESVVMKRLHNSSPTLRPPLLPLLDEGVLSTIHDDLTEKKLLPDQHLVDSGYVTIANLVQSQSDYGVDLVGPTLKTRLLPSGDRLRLDPLLH